MAPFRSTHLVVCALAAAVGAAGCQEEPNDPPLDAPAFPTGLGIARGHLLVVSSNFDQKFDRGALLSAPLDVADGLVSGSACTVDDDCGGSAACEAGVCVGVIPSAYQDAVFLPSFGDAPGVTTDGSRAYVATRKSNIIAAVDVDADGKLSCGADTPDCGESPLALQLVANDPFAIVLTRQPRHVEDVAVDVVTVDDSERLLLTFPGAHGLGAGRLFRLSGCEGFDGDYTVADPNETTSPIDRATQLRTTTLPAGAAGAGAACVVDVLRADGIATLLSSPEVFFFSDERLREPARVMQLDFSVNLGETIRGVRSALLRPEVAGTDPVVIAAVELDATQGSFGSLLMLFEPQQEPTIRSLDVTVLTGSLSIRDMMLVPGDDGANDALLVVLREPDAIARFEIDEEGALPSLRLSALESTCNAPTSLAQTSAGGALRALLTCQEADTVVALDPFTLAVTDAIRFAGRGPYEVVVGAGAGGVERAFVSFFLDGSVGVLDLTAPSDDPEVLGPPQLSFRGRIGDALPRPEDGRE